MAIQIGQKIREVADNQGYSQEKLAVKLNTTQQNISDIYNRSAVDTEFLLKVCKELSHDFFGYYYQEEPLASFKRAIEDAVQEEKLALRNEIQKLEKQVALLEENNSFQKDLIKSLKKELKNK